MEFRVLDIQERGDLTVPRSMLFDTSGESLLLPEARALNAIQIFDTASGARLTAQGLVGYIHLTNTVAVNIVPRFSVENFWKMLEIAGDSYSNLVPLLRTYAASEFVPPPKLLLRSFFYYLRQLLALGFERSYYNRLRQGYFRPRVEFGPTIARFASKGNLVNAVSCVTELGPDNEANQALKFACLGMARHVPRDSEWCEERLQLSTALQALERVNARWPGVSERQVVSTVSKRLQPAYQGALQTFSLFATGGGLAFSLAPQGRELPSFLFSLESIFERFVRCALDERLQVRGVRAYDGARRRAWLFEDDRTYVIKPDISFLKNGSKKVIGLGEVKYKPVLKESDRYQLISHVVATKAPLGIFFSPAENEAREGIEKVGRISTGSTIYHGRICLNGDLSLSCDRLAEEVVQLLELQ